jgi:hypothetical protein
MVILIQNIRDLPMVFFWESLGKLFPLSYKKWLFSASLTHIGSPASIHIQPSERSSVTPRPASSVWNVGGGTFCGACGTVKRESLDFLSNNPFYTKRFSYYVGRRCRASSINDIAKELRLDRHTVKELEKQYLMEQFRRAAPRGRRSSEPRRCRSPRGTPTGSWPAPPVC